MISKHTYNMLRYIKRVRSTIGPLPVSAAATKMPHRHIRRDFEAPSKFQPGGICNLDQQPFIVKIQRVTGNAVVLVDHLFSITNRRPRPTAAIVNLQWLR